MRSNLESPRRHAANESPRAAAEVATRLAVVLAASFVLEGCLLIGLGIGAAVPRYQEKWYTAAANPEELPKGRGVEVTAITGLGQEQIDGSLEGVKDGKLVVDSGYGTRTIPLDHVMTIRLRDGSYWATGLIMGAVVDAVVVVLAVSALSSLGPTFPAWDFNLASPRQ
jgi:hypothetical protein